MLRYCGCIAIVLSLPINTLHRAYSRWYAIYYTGERRLLSHVMGLIELRLRLFPQKGLLKFDICSDLLRHLLLANQLGLLGLEDLLHPLLAFSWLVLQNLLIIER